MTLIGIAIYGRNEIFGKHNGLNPWTSGYRGSPRCFHYIDRRDSWSSAHMLDQTNDTAADEDNRTFFITRRV